MSLLKSSKPAAYIAALAFLAASIVVGVSVGSVQVPFATSAEIIGRTALGLDFPPHLDTTFVNIIKEIRLPRVLLAVLVGAGLAIAGAAFQGLLKNPLADPYTLGVSSGSSLGAVTVIFLGLSIPGLGRFTLPAVSVLFGMITLLLLLGFVKAIERSLSTETIILAGIIFSSFLGSLISLMIALTGDELRQIISWLMGSVAMRGWEYVGLILPFFIVGCLILLWNAKELNALVFGEETAKTLGVNTKVRRMAILAAASIITGSAVAVSGTIGFVGLVVPHLTRLIWGPDHRHLLPLSMLIGGGFLALTDLLARTIIAPTELPIGVITAVAGAPVFGLLLFQQRRLSRQIGKRR
ncbi:iron ABC transporter permease [Sinobaca sp. H24]|uniref:FecCD family ABC transporter permease n=1 Tax=Sinobaca sp. H24 TaxID=2923376 RepID=UPI002079BC6D|nr:iron ABC transporter permease [Sinobaca sp. H24]